MFAAVFFDCPLDQNAVQKRLTKWMSVGPPYRSGMSVMPALDLEVRLNRDASDQKTDFPDGFLHFRYKLEMEFDETQRADALELIAAFLTTVWDLGCPAVAACDFESELPHSGGYRDRRLPWPRAVR